MMDEIKPCPLCGEAGRMLPEKAHGFYVKCTRSACMWVGAWGRTEQEAIRRWNTEWPRKEDKS